MTASHHDPPVRELVPYLEDIMIRVLQVVANENEDLADLWGQRAREEGRVKLARDGDTPWATVTVGGDRMFRIRRDGDRDLIARIMVDGRERWIHLELEPEDDR